MRAFVLYGSMLGFSVGILVCTISISSWMLAAFLFLLLVCVCLLYFVRHARTYAIAAIFLAFVLLGYCRTLLVPMSLPLVFAHLIDTKASVEGVVIVDPDVRETSQRITVEIVEGGVRTHILAVAPLYPEIHLGERVKLTGKAERPEPFATDGGRTFKYNHFLAKDGIFLVMKRASIEVMGPREGIGMQVFGMLADGKRAFLNALADALPEPAASLAGGLIAGGKQGLGQTLLDAFVRAGLVHIVVLSGYNVMIVAEAVLRLLAFLPKRIAAAAAGVTIAAFVLAAGAGSASIRAGIMAALGLTARATNRTYAVMRALVLAGFVMLLINPLLLAYDPGFQLSFVATLGLILGSPIVSERLSFVTSSFLREILSSTLAAQIAVLPLLLYQTGQLSFIAFPANLLVLPVVPAAMAASAFAGIVALIAPGLALIAGIPAFVLLSYITGMAELAANIPFGAVTVPAFSFAVTIAGYMALGWLVYKLKPATAGDRVTAE